MRISSGLVALATAGSGALAFVAPGAAPPSLRRALPTVSLVDGGGGGGEDLLDFGSFDDGKKDRDGAGGEGAGGGGSGGGGSRRRRSRRSEGEGEGGGGVDGPDKGGGASADDGPSGSIPSSFSVKDVLKGRSVAGLDVPNGIGVGTLAWGEKKRGFNGAYNIADLQGAYNTLVEGGISFFDTSEMYGAPFKKQGMSAEQMLGKFSGENFRYDSKVAAKYTPSLFANARAGGGLFKPRFGRRAVVSALEQSLERLERGYVDVYQLEAPYLPYAGGNRALYEGIARAKERGLCNAVGVCNFNAKQVAQAHAALEELGVPLVSNQVEFSLLQQGCVRLFEVRRFKRGNQPPPPRFLTHPHPLQIAAASSSSSSSSLYFILFYFIY